VDNAALSSPADNTDLVASSLRLQFTILQLITLDYWEDVYNKILASAGTPSIIFFICVIFFGSYFIINLVLAVVAMSYASAVRHVDFVSSILHMLNPFNVNPTLL
jgi:hypothetical protein